MPFSLRPRRIAPSRFWRFAPLLLLVTTLHADSPRWNILFLFADDWGRFAHSYAALDARPSWNDLIQTPHMDRLVREGVLFRHAFVSSPSCTPSRSALLSGRHFFNTGRGAILRGAIWDPAIPAFPLLLRDAGYHIGKSYKVWGPGKPADAPFGGQRHAYEKAGRAPNSFSREATQRIAQGKTLDVARAEITGQVRANFLAFLADQKTAQPWLYFFGPTNTHRPWVRGSGRALWNLDPDRLQDRMPAFLPNVPEIREDVADYLGEVQALDAYLGELIAVLSERGELDRTLIVLSGDHGMPGIPNGKCNLTDFGIAVPLIVRVPGGRPGRVIDDFVSLTDLAPTFLEVGRVPIPAHVNGRSLLTALTAPTGGLLDPTRTSVIVGRERHVDTAREGNLPYPMRAIRNADFLYVRNFAPERMPMGAPGQAFTTSSATLGADTRIGFADFDAGPTKTWLIAHRAAPDGATFFHQAFDLRPPEELYDLKKDPDQVRNLAIDPAYAKTRSTLSAELTSRLRAAGDPRVQAGPVIFDLPPFTDLEAASK